MFARPKENKEKVLPSEFLGVGDRDLSFGNKDLSFARTGSKLSVSVLDRQVARHKAQRPKTKAQRGQDQHQQRDSTKARAARYAHDKAHSMRVQLVRSLLILNENLTRSFYT